MSALELVRQYSFAMTVMIFSLAARAQAPSLVIDSSSGGQLKVSWAGAGFVLEQTSRLGTGITWSQANATVSQVNGRNTVSLAIVSSAQYFRLRRAGGPALTTIISTSPANGESGVSVNRETILEFSEALPATTVLTTNTFYAEATGRRLLSRADLSADRRRATLFYLEPVPSGSRVTVRFNGDSVHDARGQALDADGDGTAGGTRRIEFDTLVATAVAGTGVFGHVYASDPVATNGVFTNRPLAGVWVTVDGAEDRLRAMTDDNGFFLLSPCPPGRFFVHIDGRTARGSDWPDNAYYPVVGKPFEAVAGSTNNPAGGSGTIYLPLIKAGTLQKISTVQPTPITFPADVLAENPALQGVSLSVPANSLYADDGSRGGMVGIAPVPPDRLPSPLPIGLNFPLVITVQTDGPSNFDQPVPVRFPNLPDPVTGQKLPPGAKSALWSFNHDTGRWEIQGSMTVSADGNFLDTDPGVGIKQPGWHGASPGSNGTDGGGQDGPCGPEQQALENAIANCVLSTAVSLLNDVPIIGCVFNIGSGIASVISDCNDPHSSCGTSLAVNTLFAGLGCVEGPVGTVAGLFQCDINIASALADLGICQDSHSSAAPFSGNPALARQNNAADPLVQQLQLLTAGNDVVLAVLGDNQWSIAAAADPLNMTAFGHALVDALGTNSENGAEISSTERANLLALPAPGGLSLAVRTALLDRFNRFAQGGITPTETDTIRNAGNALANISGQLQSAGWTTMLDGLIQGWTNLTQQFDQQARNAANSGSPVGPNQIGPLHVRELLYRLTDQQTGLVRYGRTEASGQFSSLGLASGRYYLLSYLDPVTLQVASVFFLSGPSGANFLIPRARFTRPTDADSDGDGLTDLMEGIAGTNPLAADSDNDGVSDLAEIQQGQNPLDGIALPEGVVANLPLPGRALGLQVEGSQAFVAIGTSGLAVVDVSDPLRPLNMGRIALGGESFDVTYSPENRVAGLVALSTSGAAGEQGLLHFVDASDPLAPRLKHTFSLPVAAIDAWNGLFFVGLGQFALKEVRIYDPASTVELGSITTGDYVTGLRVTGGRAYVVTPSALEIYDVTRQPVLLGKLAGSFPVELLGRAQVVLEGNTLYMSKAQGAVSIDVSDPAKPVFLSQPGTNPPAHRAVALDGGGHMLTLSVGLSGGNSGAQGSLSVYSATTVTNLNNFLLSLSPLGAARDLVVVKGLALVADDRAGLTVINYLGPDANPVAPVITFDPPLADADPVRAGVQAIEGTQLHIAPRIQDDWQLDYTDLISGGVTVDTRRSYPAEFDYALPTLAQNGTASNFTFQVRAVDKAGHATLSPPVLIELVPDAQRPALSASLPADNGAAFSEFALAFRFDETIKLADLSQISLLNLGADHAPGGGDDSTVPLGNSVAAGSTLNMNPAASLTPGRYQVTVGANALADAAGNTLVSNLVFNFEVVSAQPDTAVWISDQDGRFADPANWLFGHLPQQQSFILQRSGNRPHVTLDAIAVTKDAVIALPLSVTNGGNLSTLGTVSATDSVDVSGGSWTLSGPAVFEKPLSILGGQVEADDRFETKDKLIVQAGGNLTFSGSNALPVISGTLDFLNGGLAVRDGATWAVSNLVTYTGLGDFSGLFPAGTTFRAQGLGSVLALPELLSAIGPTNWNVRGAPSIQFLATDGATLQLPKLATLSGRTVLNANGFSFDGKLDAPALNDLSGSPAPFPATIRVSDTSTLHVPVLALVTNCNITLDGGTWSGGSLTLETNSSLHGFGAFTSNLVVRGTLALDSADGDLSIGGDLTLTDQATLQATIGLGDGTQSGRAHVNGSATLGGSLVVTKPKSATISIGEEFEIGVFAHPSTGAFSRTDSSALGNGLSAQAEIAPDTLKLKIVAGP